MMLIITEPDNGSLSSSEQGMWLIKGREADYFEGVEVSTGEKSVFVSTLPQQNLWYRTEVIPDPDADRWRMKWSHPFLAQWRAAVGGKGECYSGMWDGDALSKLTKPYLPVEWDFSESPELSIIYVYGRSWNTPSDIITPIDILQDTLGISELRDALDIEGIRAYRTAEEPVPLHGLLTSQENRIWPEDSPGWPDVLDFSPFHSLLVRIRMVERRGVESTVTHFCEDIFNSLKGLDSRIKEYDQFLADLEDLSVEQAASLFEVEQAASLFEMVEDIEDLRSEIADLPITGVGEVSDSIGAVKRSMGTGEELWDVSEFYRFWKISTTALSERQEILTRYRNFVKGVRNKANVAVTEQPEAKDVPEEIRRLTQNVLRNRYYLEGDWRGEKSIE
jgi:hypothetical protein